MANPNNLDFEDFVVGALNASFSSAFNDEQMDSEQEDLLIHNMSESDSEDVNEQSPAPSPRAAPGTGPSQLSAINLPDTIPPSTPPPPATREQQPTPPTQPLAATQEQRPRPARPAPAAHQPTVWSDVTDNDPGPSHSIPIYSVNKGPNLPTGFDENTEPIEYFHLFFNDDLISLICHETNLYANKRRTEIQSPHARIKKWTDITAKTMNAFLGTIINMGLMPLPSIEEYYTTSWEGRVPFFSDVFNKDEFLNIFWNLHFNHRDGENRVPKGFLIEPVLAHMKEKSKLFYTPGSHVAIDESTIAFKGRVAFRVYNPMKPTKFGMKVFVVSDSENGYVYDYIPYYGSGNIIPDTSLLKTTQVVKVLSESVVLKDPQVPATGLHVYTDRYYTSPELANELLKIGCYLTGTVMTNRTGMQPGLKAKGKKMKKGDIYSLRKESTLVVSWKDKRTVHMLSTYGKGSKRHMTNVQSRWPNKPPTAKPDVVLDYIKYMGGVDRSDHFISSYQFMRRTKKWYRKIFFWLLEVAIIDSYLLHKMMQQQHGKKPLTHIQFRKMLVRALVQEKAADRPKARKRGRPAQASFIANSKLFTCFECYTFT